MIRLNSDTETRPTDAMRAAIAAAEVGDEQRREDPTVERLQQAVAALLGKEAALFLPTGTMCNLIAVKVHTHAGDLILAEADAHVLRAESGGAGLVSGVMTEPIHARSGNAPAGTFDAEDLRRALARAAALPAPWGPRARMLCLEHTHNFGGGSVWPLDRLRAVCDAAHAAGIATHMDGARLMNAVVASARPAHEHLVGVDSVWLDFTKGLGAPIGAVLAGTQDFIDRARRYKHALGGAMRQAGIAAAGCLHALAHHVERLAEDHANARRLAEGLAALPGVQLVHGMPQTNIVFFDVAGTGLDAADFAARCLAQGVRMGPVAGQVRAVTHLDISRADIETALGVAQQVIATEMRAARK